MLVFLVVAADVGDGVCGTQACQGVDVAVCIVASDVPMLQPQDVARAEPFRKRLANVAVLAAQAVFVQQARLCGQQGSHAVGLDASALQLKVQDENSFDINNVNDLIEFQEGVNSGSMLWQTVNANLKAAPANKERLQKLAEGLKPFRDAMLEPLLGSYAMRAKAILEPLAFGAGLSHIDYSEMPTRALPVPRPLPEQLHARRPIRVTAQGSYMSAISFLLRVEKEHPLVALQSFTISATTDPERQQVEMVFEWPAKGGQKK